MKDRFRIIFFESIIFFMLYYLSSKALADEYLFEWLAFNYKFYLILVFIPILLAILNKEIISILMTFGITTGVFVGNYLGGYLKKLNIAKITDSMSPGEIYMLRSHKGFYIWMAIILFSLVLGVFIEINNQRRNDSHQDPIDQ